MQDLLSLVVVHRFICFLACGTWVPALEGIFLTTGSPGKGGDCLKKKWYIGKLQGIEQSPRSPVGGHGNPLQYSCLENPMEREAWWATVHGVTKRLTWLKQLLTRTSNSGALTTPSGRDQKRDTFPDLGFPNLGIRESWCGGQLERSSDNWSTISELKSTGRDLKEYLPQLSPSPLPDGLSLFLTVQPEFSEEEALMMLPRRRIQKNSKQN